MDHKRYVGRIVRLNKDVFQPVVQRAQRRGVELENRFIVASISSDEMRKLICYGADVRVTVSTSEVALV